MRMGELGGGLGRRDGDEVGRGTEMRSGPGEFWLRLEKTFEESRLGGGEGHILLRGGGVERGWGSFYTATPLEVRLRGGGTLASIRTLFTPFTRDVSRFDPDNNHRAETITRSPYRIRL